MKNFLRSLEWMPDMLGQAGVMIGCKRYMLGLLSFRVDNVSYTPKPTQIKKEPQTHNCVRTLF